MKHIVFILLTCCFFCRHAAAQTSDTLITAVAPKPFFRMPKDPLNTVKINLLSPFYANLSLFYQRALNEENALQVGVSYMDFSNIFSENSGSLRSNERTRSVSFTPEYRYNLNGRHLSGVYISGFARYIYMNYEFDNEGRSTFYPYTIEYKQYEYHTLGLGMLIGSQVLYKRRITLDVFAGPVYNIMLASNNVSVINESDIVKSDDIPAKFLRGYGIRAGLAVGFAF